MNGKIYKLSDTDGLVVKLILHKFLYEVKPAFNRKSKLCSKKYDCSMMHSEIRLKWCPLS